MANGRPGRIRTDTLRFWRPALYQLELRACNRCVLSTCARGKPCLPVLGMPSTGRTVLAKRKPVRVITLVLVARVVPVAALAACPPETSVVYPALPRHVTNSLSPCWAKKNRAGRARHPCSAYTQYQTEGTLAHPEAIVKRHRTPGRGDAHAPGPRPRPLARLP